MISLAKLLREAPPGTAKCTIPSPCHKASDAQMLTLFYSQVFFFSSYLRNVGRATSDPIAVWTHPEKKTLHEQ